MSDEDSMRRGASDVWLAYKNLDEELEMRLQQVVDSGSTIPCKRGCTHCCYEVVFVGPPEVAGLAYGLSMLSPAVRSRVADQLVAWADAQEVAGTMLDQIPDIMSIEDGEWQRTLNKTYSTSKTAGTPCCFLLDGKCSIYPWRPSSCRQYYTVDEEAESCDFPPGAKSRTLRFLTVDDLQVHFFNQTRTNPFELRELHSVLVEHWLAELEQGRSSV